MEIVVILFGAFALAHCADVFMKARRVSRYEPPSHSLKSTISIVVCAHNEFENLKELLPLLSNQDYPKHEIIIVLDRCSDGSQQLVESYQSDRLVLLSFETPPDNIHPKKHGISEAVKAAKGEWILLTDADCRPERQWVSEMSKGMNDQNEVVLGLSPYVKEPGLLNLLIQYETFTTALQFVSAALTGKTYMGLGRNLAYRRAAFLRIGGFGDLASRIGGDDDLLVQRLATTSNVGVVLSKSSTVDSIPKKNWPDYFKQKIRHFSISSSYSSSSKIAESLRWLIHILFWLFFPLSLMVNWQLTLLIFVGSFLMKAISINIVADGLGKRFNHLWLPIVDLIYVALLPILSLRSLLVKRITWK